MNWSEKCCWYDRNYTSPRQCLIENCVLLFAQTVLLSSGLLNFHITSELSKEWFQHISSLCCFTGRCSNSTPVPSTRLSTCSTSPTSAQWSMRTSEITWVCNHWSKCFWMFRLALHWGGFNSVLWWQLMTATCTLEPRVNWIPIRLVINQQDGKAYHQTSC